MKISKTFRATIYVGAKEGYDGIIHTWDEAGKILQDYCNDKSYCVTLKSTNFIYKDGNEPGFEIGLINYPRFPSTTEEISKKANDLAIIFKEKFKQNRVSVVCDNTTYTHDTKTYKIGDVDSAVV
jgi:hypothetical protein